MGEAGSDGRGIVATRDGPDRRAVRVARVGRFVGAGIGRSDEDGSFDFAGGVSMENQRQLLLISNSTVYGRGYLDHAEGEIRDLLRSKSKVAFVPYALEDRGAYTSKAEQRLRAMGFTVTSVHNVANEARAIASAEAIFVGGGNTFRLLKSLYDHNLLEPIRRAVRAGVPYIGSSAGAIVAGPSLKTTKDMPVVHPPSFDALGLVPFQISPHYLDPDPNSTHMGETQEERIMQFLEENETPVVGLREGSMLRIEDGLTTLKGPHAARIFRWDQKPIETSPDSDLHDLLDRIQVGPAGAVL